jgi:2-oxoglutarate ferredoxin oxidoreductase subunit alpha
VSGIVSRFFARSGFHVFTHQDYESRVRGGHNFFQIRVSDRPLTGSRDEIDILVAFDRQSIALHRNELARDGMVLYDSDALKEKHEGPEYLSVPFAQLAAEEGGSKIMANTAATGAIMGMLGIPVEPLLEVIKGSLGKKGDEVIALNLKVARAGHDFASRECLRCAFAVPGGGARKLLINGNDAIGLGALLSGCKFYAAYPMTPSTGILNFMASHASQYGIVVEQAEDEIAAINMAIGASFGGVRAMTGSSGGGFALMTEGLSLAGITETPLVIAIAQRPGPATGLPTRTEQGELLFALYAGHGEFLRVIFAPGSPEQALHLTNKAFHLAEKYQIQSIILTDQYLADSEWTYEGFDLNRIRYEDFRVRGERFANLTSYKRHSLTESGVSPLAVPGEGPFVVVTDSDEHSEEGHLVEDRQTRIAMTEKRLFRKLPALTGEIDPPLFYGSENPEVVIACWGSTYGATKEVVDILSRKERVAMLHFSELYPFPGTEKFDYLRLLKGARLTLCVEQNATGRFATLMGSETGFTFHRNIRRFDGRPYTVDTLMGEINGHIAGL